MAMDEGIYKSPKKSAYSCERYQSGFEKAFMEQLEEDQDVIKWTKNHGIRIAYGNIDGKIAHYTPDFLVEYKDGRKEIVEIKGKNNLTEITKRKSKAAEEWCQKRNMKYKLIVR